MGGWVGRHRGGDKGDEEKGGIDIGGGRGRGGGDGG